MKELLHAAEIADWQQVVLNGGPPCFHIQDGRFCLRAQRWGGHEDMHTFTTLEAALRDALTRLMAEKEPTTGTISTCETAGTLREGVYTP